MEVKKKNISLRVSQQDLERLRQISSRMMVKESDLMRFAVKQMLNSLVPLQEEAYKGTDLLPALIEMGPALSSFFELSSIDLDQIINDPSLADEKRVDIEDLRLIELFGANEEYAKVKLAQSMALQPRCLDVLDLKSYLQNKYLFNSSSRHPDLIESITDIDEPVFVEEPSGAFNAHAKK